ncbi:MAG: 16S rRNA (cytosine(1402)-N(4))-methyltransferase RsmH [Acidimicrobiaceae bacterium]|nr:16S rRNA (cytosine(1402)-N(4))-methyltransferase RsmH [Acidimicrobiaceae bacterium]
METPEDERPELTNEPVSPSFTHSPVMVEEVLSYISSAPLGLVVDATVGLGGHSSAILESIEGSQILGMDRDSRALEIAERCLAPFAGRYRLVLSKFSGLSAEIGRLEQEGFPAAEAGVSAVFADLGVSSMQFDDPERGFSIRADGPLDMRMGPSGSSLTASEIVNGAPFEELVKLFYSQDEPHAKRISESIIRNRPIDTTAQLAELVEKAVPFHFRKGHIHPATRIFQALRIEVNDEENELDSLLAQALDLVMPGGVIVVLSYHSGEDRVVKDRFLEASTGGCRCPKALGCVCGAISRGVVLTRGAKLPKKSETETNIRSRSARLRAFQITGGE